MENKGILLGIFRYSDVIRTAFKTFFLHNQPVCLYSRLLEESRNFPKITLFIPSRQAASAGFRGHTTQLYYW